MKLGEDGWYHADDADRKELMEIFHQMLLEDLIVDAVERWFGISELPEDVKNLIHEEALKIYTETKKKEEEKSDG